MYITIIYMMGSKRFGRTKRFVAPANKIFAGRHGWGGGSNIGRSRRGALPLAPSLCALFSVNRGLEPNRQGHGARRPSIACCKPTPTKKRVLTKRGQCEKPRFTKVMSHAWTEHGGLQAANVLASVQVIETGIALGGRTPQGDRLPVAAPFALGR